MFFLHAADYGHPKVLGELNGAIIEKNGPAIFLDYGNNFQLPDIPTDAEVLDVGSGFGEVTRRLISIVGKDKLWAVEPFTPFNPSLVKDGQFFRQKLQDIKITKQFDIITVFKYLIPPQEREDFIKTLYKLLKPEGTIYITCIEHNKAYNHPLCMGEYIVDDLKGYFSYVDVQSLSDRITIESLKQQGFDKELDLKKCKTHALITCKSPKKHTEDRTTSCLAFGFKSTAAL